MQLMNFNKVLEEFEKSSTNSVRLLATQTQRVKNVFNVIKNGNIYIFCVTRIKAEPHYVLLNASKMGDMPFAVKVSDVKNGEIDCESIFANNFLLVEGNERIFCVLEDQSKLFVEIIHRIRAIGEGEGEAGVIIDIDIEEINKSMYVIEIEAIHVPLLAKKFPDHFLDIMNNFTKSSYILDIDVDLANYPFYHEGKI